MTPRSSLWPGVVKELRAASPILGAALTAMALSAALARGQFRGLGILAYMVGAAALGAQAFGHEFTLRTMQSLLMQPRSRRSMMRVKLVVLLALLLPLALAGRFVAFQNFDFDGARDPEITVIFWLPLVTAVGVAPWLTLLFRSAAAGMAFSLAMPGFMFTGAVIAWAIVHGDFTRVPQSYVFGVGWVGTLVVSAYGFVLGWRSFVRLEAIEQPADLLAQWRRPEPVPRRLDARRFHPVLLLIRKELRLQRMTIVIAGAYVLGSLLLLVAKPLFPDEMSVVLTVSYIALLPFMPGALASAEEHQLGTIEWQATLPVASWQQWLIKVAVVLGLTIALAVGVPALLWGGPDRVPLARLSAAVLMLAAGSLYISTTCNSTLWALLSAISVLVVVVPIASSAAPTFFVHPFDLPLGGFRILAGLAVAATVLTLAMFNHRVPRASGPAWRHGAAAVGCAACTMLALIVLI